MAHYSDSSDWEDFEEALNHAIPEEAVTGASWSVEDSPEEDKSQDEGPVETTHIISRSYQLEMLEASLKENVIVAMDTGSGKTQVLAIVPPATGSCLVMLTYELSSAVLRIMTEIEKMASDQVYYPGDNVPITKELC